jgi:hypothetical protein
MALLGQAARRDLMQGGARSAERGVHLSTGTHPTASLAYARGALDPSPGHHTGSNPITSLAHAGGALFSPGGSTSHRHRCRNVGSGKLSERANAPPAAPENRALLSARPLKRVQVQGGGRRGARDVPRVRRSDRVAAPTPHPLPPGQRGEM